MSLTGDRFDWYAILDAEFINDLARQVLAEIHRGRSSSRGLSPAQREARNVKELGIAKHLISALYSARITISALNEPYPVVVPRRTKLYKDDARQAHLVNYSWRSFNAVYETLNALGWIEVDVGTENKGFTRIHSIGQLQATFDQVGLAWFKQKPIEKHKLVVLRDRLEKPKNDIY